MEYIGWRSVLETTGSVLADAGNSSCAAQIAVKAWQLFANEFDLDIWLVAFEERTFEALETALKRQNDDA